MTVAQTIYESTTGGLSPITVKHMWQMGGNMYTNVSGVGSAAGGGAYITTPHFPDLEHHGEWDQGRYTVIGSK